MDRRHTPLLLACLAVAATDAAAQLKPTGSVTFGGIGSSANSSNRFRLEEYRDLSDGVLFGADVKGDSDTHYLQFFGENIGRDDQFIDLRGGRYGSFKFSVYNNDIPHNLTYGAITPFTGAGTNTLSFPGALRATPTTNINNWTRFDYGIKHENYGGIFELQSIANSPFYVRAAANQKRTQGVKPIGGSGTSPGGPAYELPAIVDYTTWDASAEGGYATKAMQFSLNVSWSKFQDHNDFLTWRNPSITGLTSTLLTERTTLAADNDLWKISLNAMWKQLPMNSALALRAAYSRLTNDLPVATSFTNVTNPGGNTGVARLSNPNSTAFNGEVINESFSASFTSQPTRGLDTRLYWNWAKKENKSTHVVFTPGGPGTGGACDLNPTTGAALTTCSAELFHYEKNNLGVDLQYRINSQNRVSGGWDYTSIERERIDYNESTDNKLYLEWKNTSFDAVAGKVKYQRLQRRSDFLLGGLNPALSATNLFNLYLRRYDVASFDQDLVKFVVDASPMPLLDLGAELIFKKNDYKDVTLGRTDDTRREFYVSASYGDPKGFRLTAFADYETTEYNSAHYQGTPNAATFPAAVSATTFLWTGKVKDDNYVLGLAADWTLNPRLKLNGSLIWQDTDGTVDFTANHPAAIVTNIPAYDSFRKTALNLKAIWTAQKNLDLTFGAAYETYKFDDAQMNNYNYTLVAGGQNFFSGAYAFPNYNATIGYITLTYRF